jgi:phosphoribosylaminoimidazole-succinocarboxamide synthase
METMTQALNAIAKTDFNFPGQTNVYHGKVRDVYTIDEKTLVMIVTDRISAFDIILPRAIPYKGQVLNQIAARMMDATKDIVPNWVTSVPDPNVTIGHRCEPFKVEMVIRGYLSGHAWRQYKAGKRILCGSPMPDGMKENDKFPEPIITPSTKAEVGHDEDITRDEIISHNLVSEKDYDMLADYTRKLFERGTQLAAEQGLILVDTKYEFGKRDGKIYLIDEIHTPDSSRFFYKDGYEERQRKGEPQKQLSKEFVREWLMENNFRGLEGQTMPEISDEKVEEISNRYIELYENLTGEKFIKAPAENILSRIENNILNAVKQINF